MSMRPWRTRSSRTIYQNPWLRLREDLVELPSGRTTIYGVVSTGACVGVLPFLDPDTVVLVRQYRYVAGRHTWEMPTGGVGPGEPIQAAAQRELAEESGYRAGRLEPVCVYHTSKSVMDETAHLFLASDLTRADRSAGAGRDRVVPGAAAPVRGGPRHGRQRRDRGLDDHHRGAPGRPAPGRPCSATVTGS